MQKFSKFYVTYIKNILQYDYGLWKLDSFQKCVLKIMAYPVPAIVIHCGNSQLYKVAMKVIFEGLDSVKDIDEAVRSSE